MCFSRGFVQFILRNVTVLEPSTDLVCEQIVPLFESVIDFDVLPGGREWLPRLLSIHRNVETRRLSDVQILHHAIHPR